MAVSFARSVGRSRELADLSGRCIKQWCVDCCTYILIKFQKKTRMYVHALVEYTLSSHDQNALHPHS